MASKTDDDINLSRQNSVSFKDLCKTYKSLLHKWHSDRHQDHHHHKFNISGPKLVSRTISAKVAGAAIPHVNLPQSPTTTDHEFIISSPKLLVRTTSTITPMPTPNLSRNSANPNSPVTPSFLDDEELHISSPTLLERTTSRITPISNVNRKVNNPGAEVTTPKVVSPAMTTTPIFFSQSRVRRKPPPVEKKLECTLEELCFGSIKKINIKRDALSSSGLIIEEEEVVTVKVKPGWRKGTKIVFQGKGDERPGSFPADLILEVEEKRHPLYERKGDDLEVIVEVGLVEALTGCATMCVPVLGGQQIKVRMDDDVIIYPGYETAMEGHGMPRLKEEEEEGAAGTMTRGDLRLKFIVDFPTALTHQQRLMLATLLEQ